MWALFALAQLGMGNVSESRLSSSTSTLLCPQAIETWISWCGCELYNACQQGCSFDMIAEFVDQINAIGTEKSRLDFIWKDIEYVYNNGF